SPARRGQHINLDPFASRSPSGHFDFSYSEFIRKVASASTAKARAGLTGCRALPASDQPKQDGSAVIHGARHGLEAGVFTPSANRSPALSASRAGMHFPSRNTCRTRIHSSAHATSTPPLLAVPTVPGGASTRVPVNWALKIPSVESPRLVRGTPQGERNGKKFDARTKSTIRRAGRFQDKFPFSGTSRPKSSRLLRSCGINGILDGPCAAASNSRNINGTPTLTHLTVSDNPVSSLPMPTDSW